MISILLSIGTGALTALYYLPHVYPYLEEAGIYMQNLRSLHTTFAIAWIYLAAITIIQYHLFKIKKIASRTESYIVILQTGLWVAAGLGALGSLALGKFSGREYIEYQPFVSFFVLGGWFLFAWIFFSRVRRGFWHQPVYIYMWATGILLFIYTYIEGHAWLLSSISEYPIVDIQIQWKSVGTMVGSFNLLVYGVVIYLNEKISGNESYGQSRTAFLLFGVGLLNSFTNYAHHTYHLPQAESVKWISFVVSMSETIILLRVFYDLFNGLRQKKIAAHETTVLLLNSARWWTAINLVLAILISIPPVNTLIHGTHTVVAHSMATMVGIDSFILLGGISWLLSQIPSIDSFINARRLRFFILVFNVSLTILFGSLLTMGLTNGIYDYLGLMRPTWSSLCVYLFVASGLVMGLSLARILLHWLSAMKKIPDRDHIFQM